MIHGMRKGQINVKYIYVSPASEAAQRNHDHPNNELNVFSEFKLFPFPNQRQLFRGKIEECFCGGGGVEGI